MLQTCNSSSAIAPAALSCSKAVNKFLQTPKRRSCAFVNPSEDVFAELSRTAKDMSFKITQTTESNVGTVVRISRWTSVLGTVEGSPNTGPVSSGAVSPLALPGSGPPTPALPAGSGAPTPTLPGGPGGISRMVSFNTEGVVNQVRRVVSDSSRRPELTEEGTGGVYMIRENSGEASCEPSPLAVFKPSDEEAGSANNPRGLSGKQRSPEP